MKNPEWNAQDDSSNPYDTNNLLGVILKNGEVVVICGSEEDPEYFVYKNREMFSAIVKQINNAIEKFERKVN